MSNEKGKPPEDEARTVFDPGSAPTTPPAATPADPAQGTVAPEATINTSFTAREKAKGIQVGDVLNHIFEVKRFLARGGMGEVFEGCNVNSDERVAIKVMLPTLAADEKVIAMFRKEARTLTRLQHEALVQYRVLAQEPQLGVLYIVTEYIDGVNLADALGEMKPTPEEQAGLLRRLASGLRAAHMLGAIHRDMSPDNVLLADGKLSKAKIIDFGIAKDLDASSATIVGDGFAGKLNYVAPEQLGDFSRDIGPWTDVYSLGLVMLAVAGGKNVNMSGSLVDAIDKRRKGPDLSKTPEILAPVLEAMLRADPAQRLRSMDEVLAMLDKAGIHAPHGESANPYAPAAPTSGGGIPRGVLIGGGVLAAAAIAGAFWFASQSGGDGIVGVSREPADVARSAIDSALPSVSCTWLEIGSIEGGGEGLRIAMRGVAGNAANAQADLTRTLQSAGITDATINFGDVAPITPAGCTALDSYRQVQAADADRLTVPSPRFEMEMQPAGAQYAGKEASNAVINLSLGDPELDFALIGIEPSGAISTILPSRAAFQEALAASENGKPIQDLGGDKYRLAVDVDHEGWSGVMLVTGKGPFDPAIVQPPIGARGPDWQQSFVSAAAANGWNTEMVWFASVNEQPQ